MAYTEQRLPAKDISASVEGLLSALPLIALDALVARIHASQWAALARRGISVGERDLMIAATAMA
jgi:predicted nucleic acid-binding protein